MTLGVSGLGGSGVIGMLRKFLFTASDDYCKIGTKGTGAGVLIPTDSEESILPILLVD